jgi:tetratricopeptide (TPR) repeat protein
MVAVPTHDAFISYSQRKDRPIALALRSVIQTIGNPWWKARSCNVFLDATSLSATPRLWSTLEATLASCRYLVLLASPEAAASGWVEKELLWWLHAEGKGVGRLLIAWTDGELEWDPQAGDFKHGKNTAIPPCLQSKFIEEPLWVDLREYRSHPERATKKNREFLARALDLACTIRGVAKEDLYSEEISRQRRNLTWAYGAAVGLGGLALLTTAAAWVAATQWGRAERALDQIVGTANTMAFELARRFSKDIGVPQSVVLEVLDEARKPMDALASESRARPELALSRGLALIEISSTLLTQSDSDGAAKAARNAIAVLEVNSPPKAISASWRLARLGAYERLGDALHETEDRQGSLNAYELMLRIAEELVRESPETVAFAEALASAHEHLGDFRLEATHLSDAETHYRRSLAIREMSLARFGPTEKALLGLASAHGRIAQLLVRQSHLSDAHESYRTCLAIVEPIASSNPGNSQVTRDLSVYYQGLGNTSSAQGNSAEARQWFEKDLAASRQLAAHDLGRILWQRDLVSSLDRVATLDAEQGLSNEAITLYREAYSVSEKTITRDPNRPSWHRDSARILEKIGELMVKGPNKARALEPFEQAAAIRAELTKSNSGNLRWQEEYAALLRRTSELQSSLGRKLDALDTASKYLDVVRRTPETDEGKTERVARALGTVSWASLLAGDFVRAVSAGREAVELARGSQKLIWVKLNLAHALLFSGEWNEARALYLSGLRGNEDESERWRLSLLNDFETLQSNNMTIGMMELIKAEVGH